MGIGNIGGLLEAEKRHAENRRAPLCISLTSTRLGLPSRRERSAGETKLRGLCSNVHARPS